MRTEREPLTIRVATTISRELDDCFSFFVPVPLENIFHRTLFLPGVKRTDEVSKWMTAGMTRTIYFTDRTRAEETLERVDRPTSFSYKVQNFTGINRFLIDHIYGRWEFAKAGSATQIVWQYELYSRSRLAAVAMRATTPVVRRMLVKALNILKLDLEG